MEDAIVVCCNVALTDSIVFTSGGAEVPNTSTNGPRKEGTVR